MVETRLPSPSEAAEMEEVRTPLASRSTGNSTNGNGCHANGHRSKGIANGHVEPDASKAFKCPDAEIIDSSDCGMWSFRPSWLQPFANKKAFLAVFCLTSVLQGMYYTYFVSVLTTIEKLFQIQSKTTGIIMSATEIGQIGGALLLTYYGGQGHRPKWIACGMLVFAAASILCSTPHFLFGGGEDVASELGPINATTFKLRELNARLCHDMSRYYHKGNNSKNEPSKSPRDIPASIDALIFENVTQQTELAVEDVVSRTPFYKGRIASRCDSPDNTAYQTRVTHAVLAVFFVSLLFIGIGATAVYTLGIPYIDDNVATRESPLYFGKFLNNFITSLSLLI